MQQFLPQPVSSDKLRREHVGRKPLHGKSGFLQAGGVIEIGIDAVDIGVIEHPLSIVVRVVLFESLLSGVEGRNLENGSSARMQDAMKRLKDIETIAPTH